MATSQTSKQEELVAQQGPSDARGGVRADLLTDETPKTEFAHKSKFSSLYNAGAGKI